MVYGTGGAVILEVAPTIMHHLKCLNKFSKYLRRDQEAVIMVRHGRWILRYQRCAPVAASMNSLSVPCLIPT